MSNTETSQLSVGRVTTPIVADYLLSHLGFFAVLPVLPVLIRRLGDDVDPWFVGLALFVFTFCVRGSSLFFAGVLHRTSVRIAMSGGLLLSAGSFGLLSMATLPAGVLVLLTLAGVGISTNGLMARVFIAMSLPGTAERNTVFSTIQVAVNVSAAMGPIAANLLVSREDGRTLLLAVATMYCLAALVVAATVPAGLVSGRNDIRPPLRLGLVKEMWQRPEVRQVSLVTVVGSFLYAQLFSALVLHISELTDSPIIRASFFTANAVLVVVAQIPVALFVRRRLENGTSPLALLVWGTAGFGLSFVVLGSAGALLAGTFAGVAVFSLAETLFTPMVNTAYSELPGERPLVELFNMRQVAATVGESAGAFAGGALFLFASQHAPGWAYWTALALVAAVVVLVFRGQLRASVQERSHR